jgi:hypothetical protein
MIKYLKNNKMIISVVVLVLLSIFSLVWFVGTVHRFARSGQLTADYSIRKGHPTRINHSLNVNSVNTWMTFDYINVIFKLPKSYLQNTFNISDPRYPNIRIGNYTKQHKLNSSQFMDSLKQAITNYSGIQ